MMSVTKFRDNVTKDMARAIDSDVQYRNLEEYWEWRNRVPPER